jgi:ankyrin repeat protein
MREARIRPALANTCNWIFQETRFVNWDLGRDTDNSHGMLWIKGKPGAGKSTLMKTALHWASSKHGQDTIIASFFFNARGKEIERGPHGLYRSLLHQITKQDSAIMQWFQRAYQSKRLATRSKWEWTEEELEVLLRDALSVKRMKPICFFVDALDECDEAKARELVQYFRMLTDTAHASGQVLKICLSSRHYPTITIDRCPEIVVEGSNNNDISTYVNSTLHSHELIHGPSVADLQESIIRQASGIFLWVVLVVGIVARMLDEGKESREVEGVLQKVPRDLDLLFTNILREVKHDEKERSLALIRWILFAREHLSIDSVYLAVIFSTETPYQPIGPWPQINKHQTHPQQLARMIRNLSKGLIEISSRGVQFIHEAVRGFFIHGSGLAILENKPGSPSTALGHLTIIRGCLHHAYLEELMPTIRPLVPDRSLEQSKWAFARSNCYWFSFYAARQLYSHISEPEFSEIVPKHMKQLLASSMRRLQRAWPLWELGMIGNRIVPWKTDQFTLVEEALNLVHRLMADLQNADFSDTRNPHEPDSSFLRRCLQRHVEKVPKEEQGLGLQSWTSLHRRACVQSPHPYIDELSESSHVYSRDVRGRTPLHIAAMQGNLPFARVLLQNGANPISVDAAGYTALHFASRVHDVDMCRLLLSQSRMIPNISTNIGHTPLHSAVLSGSIQVTQLLLEAGHSIDAQTCYGRTPIQIAVECGDDRLVRYLHGAGANAGLLDDQRMTALLIQENYAHYFLGMTKSLNPRVTGRSETNPKKMLASRTGHRSVVSMPSLPTSKDTSLLGDAESDFSVASPY